MPYHETFESFGEFLAAVAAARVGGIEHADRRLFAAATGSGEAVPSDGGFLVQDEPADQACQLLVRDTAVEFEHLSQSTVDLGALVASQVHQLLDCVEQHAQDNSDTGSLLAIAVGETQLGRGFLPAQWETCWAVEWR